MTRVDDYLIPDDDECILLDDSGCDQSIINISAFKVFTHTSVFYNLGGAMKDFASSHPIFTGVCMINVSGFSEDEDIHTNSIVSFV